jgi:hypothetical protein
VAAVGFVTARTVVETVNVAELEVTEVPQAFEIITRYVFPVKPVELEMASVEVFTPLYTPPLLKFEPFSCH